METITQKAGYKNIFFEIRQIILYRTYLDQGFQKDSDWKMGVPYLNRQYQ